jgi:hypothetical protein
MNMLNFEHAEKELDLLESCRSDIKDYRPGLMAILVAFKNAEYPGWFAETAAVNIGLIVTALLSQKSIMPVGGDESEWVDMSQYGNPNERCDQNKRNSAVFRDDKGVYYLDAIVWVNENGNGTSGWVEGYSSLCYTPVVPFTPMTFKINVRTIDAENHVYEIIDKFQLEQVWKHYKKQEPNNDQR